MVFQEPMTSMDPVMRIGPQIEECLLNHRRLSKAQRRQLALEAMLFEIREALCPR